MYDVKVESVSLLCVTVIFYDNSKIITDHYCDMCVKIITIYLLVCKILTGMRLFCFLAEICFLDSPMVIFYISVYPLRNF